MESLPALLGYRIKRLRVRQHRTLEAIASESGFTKSLLSKIERGKTTPPIATLLKIANVLGVNIADLLSDDTSAETVFTSAKVLGENSLTRTEKGYRFHLFAGNRPDKLMQPFLFIARKGMIKPALLSHRGEEFIYVLSGEMVYTVGGTRYELRAGDSLYFDSEQKHDLKPVSQVVTYLAVFVDAPIGRPRRKRKRREKS
jgi:transcriptional regulator with XRE-family HTH domain